MMPTHAQRYARLLLAVFVAGALLLPFAHEFTHLRSLEHQHGRAAADFSLVAVGPGGADAVDFFVEERTVPHNPNCDLCARLMLDAPLPSGTAVPLGHLDAKPLPGDAYLLDRTSSHRQIRAPPCTS